jgi:2-C-methyl-D-erythritol 4-phosphate cytidylyltransferase
MGGPRKQFRLLGGQSLLVQTLRLFEEVPDVGYIVVAAPEDAVPGLEAALYEAGLKRPVVVVQGGATRQASVGLALATVPDSAGVILVHDAVRPFVTVAQVEAVIASVRMYGAAALAVPVTDTVRRGREGCFEETLSRTGLYRMQTPQGSRRSWLLDAYAAAAEQGTEATDDVELVQRLGHPVHIVEGSAYTVKITTSADWEMARLIWPSWAEWRRRPVDPTSKTEA